MSETTTTVLPTMMVTTAQAADALQVSADTVLRLIRSGALPAVNLGQGSRRERLRIRVSDLTAYVDRGAPEAKRASRRS